MIRLILVQDRITFYFSLFFLHSYVFVGGAMSVYNVYISFEKFHLNVFFFCCFLRLNGNKRLPFSGNVTDFIQQLLRENLTQTCVQLTYFVPVGNVTT